VHRLTRSEVKVVAKIGEGAFGEVSRAQAPLYGTVAVKWLKVGGRVAGGRAAGGRQAGGRRAAGGRQAGGGRAGGGRRAGGRQVAGTGLGAAATSACAGHLEVLWWLCLSGSRRACLARSTGWLAYILLCCFPCCATCVLKPFFILSWRLLHSPSSLPPSRPCLISDRALLQALCVLLARGRAAGGPQPPQRAALLRRHNRRAHAAGRRRQWQRHWRGRGRRGCRFGGGGGHHD
jgi:hypothetical protein